MSRMPTTGAYLTFMDDEVPVLFIILKTRSHWGHHHRPLLATTGELNYAKMFSCDVSEGSLSAPLNRVIHKIRRKSSINRSEPAS